MKLRQFITKLYRFIYVAFCVLLCMTMMLAAGCIIQIGDGSASSGDSGGTGAGEPTPTASVLPAPDNVPSDSSNLTPEQQARKEEVERYVVENLYKGYKILRTVEDPHGDVIDWIAPESMAQLPYEPPTLPLSVDQLVLPDGVELAKSELEKYPELFGPIGSTPLHRPMYWRYVLGETGATSIQDYLDNYQQAGQSGAPANRLYAGMLFDGAPNRGLSGYMNQLAPRVEKDSFSLMEFAVVCKGAPGESVQEELIGIVLSIDKSNFVYPKDPDAVRLHVETYRTVNGVQHGGWDTKSPGFVPNPYNTRYPLGSVVEVSIPGVKPVGKEVEHLVSIVQAPTGDWWLVYNGWFLGYVKGSLFTMLNKGGCSAEWYLEALDRKPGTAWAETEMGAGKFVAEAGPGEAARVRMPLYLDMNWVLSEPPVYYGVSPVNNQCYTRSKLMDLGLVLGKYFLAGGPGGYNSLCTK